MPKKGGRGRVSEKDAKRVKNLIDAGFTIKQICEKTGWCASTIRTIKRGALESERQKRMDNFIRSQNQGGQTAPQESPEPPADLSAFTDTPSPIAQFLKDLAIALVKLADGLDAREA